MSFSIWLSFLSISLITTFSPGPAILLAMSNAGRGVGKALTSSAGNALGIFLVSGAAMIGLGALLRASLVLFTALKIVGALYLIYLGVRQWRGAGKPAQAKEALQPAQDTASSPAQLFREGLLVALTNPKSIIFFTALFPQFIQTQAPILPQFFVLTLTFVGCSLLAHATYIVVARGASARLTAGNTVRILQRASGALFMSLGVALLAVKRS